MRAIPELRATVAGIAKAHGSKPRRQAAPLLAVAALPIAGVCGGDLRGERESALILLGFADALRRSELIGIRVGDLRFCEPGLSVFLPRSKEDQVGEGALVHIGRNPLAAHCPIAALKSWLEVSGTRAGWGYSAASSAPAH